MAAFDALPAAVRSRLNYLACPLSAVTIQGLLHSTPVPEMLRMIRGTGEAFVKQASAEWQKRYGCPTPHVAADATIMVTEPLDRPVPPLRKRRPLPEPRPKPPPAPPSTMRRADGSVIYG